MRSVEEAKHAKRAKTCLARDFDFAPSNFFMLQSFGLTIEEILSQVHKGYVYHARVAPWEARVGLTSVAICCYAWSSWAVCFMSDNRLWLVIVLSWHDVMPLLLLFQIIELAIFIPCPSNGFYIQSGGVCFQPLFFFFLL